MKLLRTIAPAAGLAVSAAGAALATDDNTLLPQGTRQIGARQSPRPGRQWTLTQATFARVRNSSRLSVASLGQSIVSRCSSARRQRWRPNRRALAAARIA